MPTTWDILLWGTAAALAWLILLWAVHLIVRDAGLVDFGWAAAIGGLAVAYGIAGAGSPAQRWLAAILGGVWGFRLALHLLFDRVLAGGEDSRYAYLREHWGPSANWQFLWFFAAQAILAVLFSLPFFVISGFSAAAFAPVQYAGILLAFVSLGGEAVADRQLARFRTDPSNKGKTCRDGLWRYSRHPNYFFEWLIWCAVALIAWPAPSGAWAILAPVAMYFFVTKITGIPYTEAQSLRSRGEDYRAYQRETNAFFPGPWRSDPRAAAKGRSEAPRESIS